MTFEGTNTHPSIVNGWFREVNDEAFPGQAFSLRVDRILYHKQSEFQDILVFKSTDFGNVLVLDGIVQCTERDEFAYQEMITHVPLYLHENPRDVLVIGGGDGGVLREVIKHKGVERVTLVEIDRSVIELSQRFLPNMARGFDDPRVTVELCDGFKFLASVSGKYDVIITDSSDPEGPAEAFFHENYYNLLRNALRDENGIVIAQTSENMWLNSKYLKNLLGTAGRVFPNVRYCYTMVPSYTSGQLGLMVCSPNKQINLAKPSRVPTDEEQANMKYYNKEIHSASFVLPTWVENYLKQ